MGHVSRIFGTSVPTREKSNGTLARRAGSTEILDEYPRCTIGVYRRLSEPTLRNMQCMASLRGYMEIGYNGWMGHSVVLHVALGDIRVPLRGKLLKENSDSVRLRIGEGWDVDIYKAMIQAVEEDKMAMIPA